MYILYFPIPFCVNIINYSSKRDLVNIFTNTNNSKQLSSRSPCQGRFAVLCYNEMDLSGCGSPLRFVAWMVVWCFIKSYDSKIRYAWYEFYEVRLLDMFDELDILWIIISGGCLYYFIILVSSIATIFICIRKQSWHTRDGHN